MASRPGTSGVLRGLGHLLSAGFDPGRVQERVLDVAVELVGPSCASLLLEQGSGKSFAIAAQRGLTPQVATAVRLESDGGLPLWLTRAGRPVHAHDVAADTGEALGGHVARQLAMLRAVVALPLFAQDELVAILALGRRIVGSPYERHEMEMLFELGSRAAVTLRTARLHRQLRDERAYIERVLAHITTGVLAIDRRERVTVINRRAEEILELASAEVLDRDLRRLPSPLGDLMYEALRTGRASEHREVQIVRPRAVLEVGVYPIAAGDESAAGAALVFEDVSAAKELARQRRRQDFSQLVSGLVRHMTDQVRQPLESVRQTVERLAADPEAADVDAAALPLLRHDARRLVEIAKTISALVEDGELTFELLDIQKVLDECLADLEAVPGGPTAPGERVLSLTELVSGRRAVARVRTPKEALVGKWDRRELETAIAYLVRYLVRRGAGEPVEVSIVAAAAAGATPALHLLLGARVAEPSPGELQRMFDPLEAVRTQVFDVGPCASRRIVEAHDGKLDASLRGDTLTFRVELPVERARRNGSI